MEDQIITKSFDTLFCNPLKFCWRDLYFVDGMAANHFSLIYYLIQINTGKLEKS